MKKKSIVPFVVFTTVMASIAAVLFLVMFSEDIAIENQKNHPGLEYPKR